MCVKKSNVIPSTHLITNPNILFILLLTCKHIFITFCLKQVAIFPCCLFVLWASSWTRDPAQPLVSCSFRLMEVPCVTRATAAVNFVITQKDLYGVGCGEGCRSRLRKCQREREREIEHEQERERKRALNKTPTHLHSVSAIQHLAEMVSSSFWCKIGL